MPAQRCQKFCLIKAVTHFVFYRSMDASGIFLFYAFNCGWRDTSNCPFQFSTLLEATENFKKPQAEMHFIVKQFHSRDSCVDSSLFWKFEETCYKLV